MIVYSLLTEFILSKIIAELTKTCNSYVEKRAEFHLINTLKSNAYLNIPFTSNNCLKHTYMLE